MTTAVQPYTGTWTADPVHSSFGFAVEYAGTGKFRGTLDDVTATLSAGDDGLSLEGAARVESISIRSPEQFRAHVLGARLLRRRAATPRSRSGRPGSSWPTTAPLGSTAS